MAVLIPKPDPITFLPPPPPATASFAPPPPHRLIHPLLLSGRLLGLLPLPLHSSKPLHLVITLWPFSCLVRLRSIS